MYRSIHLNSKHYNMLRPGNDDSRYVKSLNLKAGLDVANPSPLSQIDHLLCQSNVRKESQSSDCT